MSEEEKPRGLGIGGAWRKQASSDGDAVVKAENREPERQEVREQVVSEVRGEEQVLLDLNPITTRSEIHEKPATDRLMPDQKSSSVVVQRDQKPLSDRSENVPKVTPRKASNAVQRNVGFIGAPRKKIYSRRFKDAVKIVSEHLQKHCYSGEEISTVVAAHKFYRETPSMKRILLVLADEGVVEKIAPGEWRYLG